VVTIDVNIPDWAKGRNLRIFAGIELLAYKRPTDEKWHVKVSRCNMCGKCCMNLPDYHYLREWRDPETGNCKYLEKRGDTYECKLGMGRPFACCMSNPSRIEECSEKFEVV